MSEKPIPRVLVTGSSRGIGRAIARELAALSYRVTVHCRNGRDAAEETLSLISAQGSPAPGLLQFDVSDRAAARDALSSDIAEHGAYYGVVCNAGLHRDAPFPGLTDADWDDVLRTNLDGFYNVLKPLVMPMIQLRSGGRIVTVSSLSGIAGNRGQVNYSAAKAGVIGATKALSKELAKRKITVNCVAPGLIETDMTGDVAQFDELVQSIPMQRPGKPEEVSAVVGFLFSERASYVTGQVISVNGGVV